jgi:hypothetical protein
MPPELLHNFWLWCFVLLAPILICLGSLRSSGVSLAIRTFIAALLGWPVLLMAVIRAWDLRVEFLPYNATTAELQAATADGANKVFTLLFGWIPSTLWSALILIVWIFIRKLLRSDWRKQS